VKIDELIGRVEDVGADMLASNSDYSEVAEAARLLRECHAAGFISDDGEARKVLGTLPLTADGVMFSYGKVYVHGFQGGVPCIFEYDAYTCWDGEEPYIGHLWGEKIPMCYSTREAAAEAARGEK
jgi:hypothetical protein